MALEPKIPQKKRMNPLWPSQTPEARKAYEDAYKAKRASVTREWYENNRDRYRRKKLEWRRENPELVSSYGRKYRELRPWKSLLYSARSRAKRLGLEYSLSPLWAESVWTGRCALSGVELRISNTGSHGIYSPSIDRIDQSKGYTPENSRFICMGMNGLRGAGSDDDAWALIKAAFEFRATGLT